MESTHQYNLRSKTDLINNNKTPALKTVDLTIIEKNDQSKLNFTPEAAELLKSIMFEI